MRFGLREPLDFREDIGRLIGFPLEDGGSILVQVAAGAAGPVTPNWVTGTRWPSRPGIRSSRRSLACSRPRLVWSVGCALADAPEEIGVEFGPEFSAEAGAFMASASSAANFRVTLIWRRDRPGRVADG
jgi:hypothetical protein